MRSLSYYLLIAVVLAGCRPEDQPVLPYIAHLPVGEQQRAILCDRGNDDRFFNWYCAGPEAPQIETLDELLISLELKDPDALHDMRFAMTAHSTSIVARNSTVLNPRVIVFTAFNDPRDDYIAVGYLRGEGFTEAVAYDVTRDSLNFYLVTYQTGCEPDCSNAERFLPRDEVGWMNVSVYGDADLQNTVYDCLRCHIPGGGQTRRILRMQEIAFPWTHWFDTTTESHILLDAFLEAHAGEDYGGVPAERLGEDDPLGLEAMLTVKGFSVQPNAYNGGAVNGDDPGVVEPNEVWLDLYANAVNGAAIPPPHYRIDPFDSDLVEDYGYLYRRIRDGLTGASNMPDLTQIFDKDEERYLSFRPAEGLDAKGIVHHACGNCHDGRFPNISRNNFRIQDFPDQLTPEMRKNIAARLVAQPDTALRMPPPLGTQLSGQEIGLILDALD